MQFTFTETATERKNRLHIDALSILVQWAAMASDESELADRIDIVNKRMTSQTQADKRAQFDTAARDAYAAQNAAQDSESTDAAPDAPETDSATDKPAQGRKKAA